jgi:sulfur-oxidizing protein SoxX
VKKPILKNLNRYKGDTTMNKSLSLFALTFLLALQGCDSSPESPRGFSLPEGNAVEGEKVFTKYQCLACHNMEGFDYETINKELQPPVLLGGSTTRVKTYADLVTSVINPSHKLARNYHSSLIQKNGVSTMPVFNDVMTITELVDLVTFLQPKYSVVPPQFSEFKNYGY